MHSQAITSQLSHFRHQWTFVHNYIWMPLNTIDMLMPNLIYDTIVIIMQRSPSQHTHKEHYLEIVVENYINRIFPASLLFTYIPYSS